MDLLKVNSQKFRLLTLCIKIRCYDVMTIKKIGFKIAEIKKWGGWNSNDEKEAKK